MTIGDQDHGRVSMSVAAVLARIVLSGSAGQYERRILAPPRLRQCGRGDNSQIDDLEFTHWIVPSSRVKAPQPHTDPTPEL